MHWGGLELTSEQFYALVLNPHDSGGKALPVSPAFVHLSQPNWHPWHKPHGRRIIRETSISRVSSESIRAAWESLYPQYGAGKLHSAHRRRKGLHQ